MNFEAITKHTQSLLCTQKEKPTIILGLSGGPDSVFLFFVLKQLHEKNLIRLICAHLNHGWRDDADNDVQFCKKLCNTHTVPLISEEIKNLDIKPKFNGSQEELGRIYRRHFFAKLKKHYDADFIALAHHRQDQQETFFLRLMRGSSLAGLTCMKAIDGTYVRPLLNIDKDTILTWLTNNNITYLTDPTNASDNYLRNKIRKYIIPACKQCDARFDQNMTSTLASLNAENNLLQQITKQTYESIFSEKNGDVTGNLSQFRQLEAPLQKRVLLHWLITQDVNFNVSSGFLEELCRFLRHSNGGTHNLNPTWSLTKKKNLFWIIKNKP